LGFGGLGDDRDQWTPAEIVEELEERPNTFAYELGEGVEACVQETAD
jgi:hypothetical protein